jgi:hypothetical protein
MDYWGAIGLVPGYYFFWPWTPGISRLNYHVRQALLALIVALGAGTGQLTAYLLEFTKGARFLPRPQETKNGPLGSSGAVCGHYHVRVLAFVFGHCSSS